MPTAGGARGRSQPSLSKRHELCHSVPTRVTTGMNSSFAKEPRETKVKTKKEGRQAERT